ncbi:MAG: hypothetical protein WA446_04710 [Steroidobacteraceae bacterium]
MAGRHILFVPGPTNVPDCILRAMGVPMEDHRSSSFPALARECLTGLKSIFKTQSGVPFIFPSSGTGCWEAALTNCLNPGDRGQASYDIGAGGRGLTTDCHDDTNAIIIDGANSGPTTWGSCRELGCSTGLDFKF